MKRIRSEHGGAADARADAAERLPQRLRPGHRYAAHRCARTPGSRAAALCVSPQPLPVTLLIGALAGLAAEQPPRVLAATVVNHAPYRCARTVGSRAAASCMSCDGCRHMRECIRPCSERMSRAAQSSTTRGWACSASASTTAGSTPPSTACLLCAQRPALPAPGGMRWVGFHVFWAAPLRRRAHVPHDSVAQTGYSERAGPPRRHDGPPAPELQQRAGVRREGAVRSLQPSCAHPSAQGPLVRRTSIPGLCSARGCMCQASAAASWWLNMEVSDRRAQESCCWARRCCRHTPQPSGAAC